MPPEVGESCPGRLGQNGQAGNIDSEEQPHEHQRDCREKCRSTRSNAVGQPMSDLLIPPSLRERHREGMARYLATGEDRIFGKTLEMKGMRADGSEFPIELTVTRLPSDGPTVFTGYIHDISDRKRAESDLRESEERFRVAAQISTDLVYEWDLESDRVRAFHVGSGSSIGMRLPSTGEEWVRLIHSEDRERVLASVQRTLDIARLAGRKSIFLFGPRQTGKTALVLHALPKAKVYDLLDGEVFLAFSHRPARLGEELGPADKLVVLDEIQKLPALLDEVHRLIEQRGIRFVLTGSSARKLRCTYRTSRSPIPRPALRPASASRSAMARKSASRSSPES